MWERTNLLCRACERCVSGPWWMTRLHVAFEHAKGTSSTLVRAIAERRVASAGAALLLVLMWVVWALGSAITILVALLALPFHCR